MLGQWLCVLPSLYIVWLSMIVLGITLCFNGFIWIYKGIDVCLYLNDAYELWYCKFEYMKYMNGYFGFWMFENWIVGC